MFDTPKPKKKVVKKVYTAPAPVKAKTAVPVLPGVDLNAPMDNFDGSSLRAVDSARESALTAKSVADVTTARASSDAGYIAPRKSNFLDKVGLGGLNDLEKPDMSRAKDLIPFASNMLNAFRKPPMPKRPGTLSPVTLGKVSYANERTEADRLVRGADLGAERGLDGNTAASVRAGNLSQKFRMYSDSYARENNENTDITNKQTMINAGIDEKNTRGNDFYNQQVVERRIAQQGQQSANVANAADKYISIQNEQAKRDLEAKNFAITSKVFENSGVLKRLMGKLQAEGIDDPSNTKRYGGKLKGKLKRAYK